MKYGMLPIKVHPFEVPILSPGTPLEGKIFTTAFRYPNPENPNKHPLRIDWKYRLTNKGEHIFSYIAESKFIIEDDGIPFDFTQLDRFIGDLYINAEMGWEDGTRNTPLGGTTLPLLDGANLDMIRQQILDLLK